MSGNFRTAFFGSLPLDKAVEEYLLTLYRNWYVLPLKATRPYLEEQRRALAAQLRDEGNAGAAVKSFVQASGRLPDVSGLAGAALANVRKALDAAQTLTEDARRQLAELAAADDAFSAALQRYQYSDELAALAEVLRQVRSAASDASERLPAGDKTRIDAVLTQHDSRWPTTDNNYETRVVLLQATLKQLEAIPAVLRIAWQPLLTARVIVDTTQPNAKDVVWRSAAPTPVATPAASSPTPAGLVPKGVIGPKTATLYSDVRFPGKVKQLEETLLIVRLTPQRQADSVATTEMQVPFVDPAKPEQVDIVVSAPGFRERFSLWRRTIIVYSDQDSQPAVFFLKSSELGDKQITIDFYHSDRSLATVSYTCQVHDGATSGAATPVKGAGVEITAFPPQMEPPPDLELRIVRGNGDNKLYFTLHSNNPVFRYHWLPVGEKTINVANPQEFLEYKYDWLSQQAANHPDGLSDDEVQTTTARLRTIGTELWDELLPDNFKNEYWKTIKPRRDQQKAAGKTTSLLITTDDPWIPWEMVRPYSYDTASGTEMADEFWAEGFQLCRWLAGRGPAQRVEVSAARMVAPKLDLAYVEQERQTFDQLAQSNGLAVTTPLQTRADVQQILREGGVQLLHFAAHGSFEPENANRSRLTLSGGSLTPDDLIGEASSGLRKSNPLVFMNACSIGRMTLSLTGLAGWAEKMVNTGRVSAFIGTLFEVNDELAAEFMQVFYTRLFAGDTLGVAFHTARLALRDHQIANPTWLAYVLYGDPNSRVMAKKP